jgi:hypothetical protein
MRTVPQLAAAVLLVGLATSGGATEPVSPAQPGPTYDLEFSTFLGGSGQDQIRDVATDSPGNIYLVGGTVSPDFPTTPGAYQRIHNPGNPDMSGTIRYDIFVTKLDATGRLLWSTLVGGRNYDRAYAVAADSQGFVYVAGRAGRGFPVSPGAFQTVFMGTVNANPNPYGEQDGVIFKLKPDGSDLVWASYFGADDAVIVRDMSIDRGGNAYLATGVLSSTVNVPPGWSTWFSSGFQKSPQGGRDSIVAKISPDGSRVVWASFFGGSGDDSHNPTIAVDENGSAYLAGNTRSTDLPVTPGAYDTTPNGGSDGYVARFSADGSSLIYATYLGGSGDESPSAPHGIAIDLQGHAYPRGFTRSSDFPTTPGAVRTTSGTADGFVSKLSPDGTQLLASTFLDFGVEGVAVDSQANVYVTGGTQSPITTTPDAYQSALKGAQDAALLKLAADFSSLLYATYMGGASAPQYGEAFRGIAVDSDGNIVAGGVSGGTDWPRLHPAQGTYGGGTWDAVVAKFGPRAAEK